MGDDKTGEGACAQDAGDMFHGLRNFGTGAFREKYMGRVVQQLAAG